MAKTIPANNNTGLYNTTPGTATPINANVYATNISASGNVTVDGYITANGSISTNSNFVGPLTGTVTGDVYGNLYGNLVGNITISGANTQVIYNNDGFTGASPAFTFNQDSNVLSVTGNISSQYFIGNGSQLTGITGGTNYSNANVAAFLPTYSGALAGANLSVSGNVTGAYILGNGSQLTGLPATYGNSNVSTYLASGTNSNNIVTGGNIQGGNLITSGAFGNITGANYVSASYFVGDGSLLTNVAASYGNSNVTTLLASFGSNTVSTTGNISAGYFVGNGSLLTGIATSSYGNANVNTLLAAWGSNALSTTGNVTASYHIGNGSLLTNITGANVAGQVANALIAGTVYTAAQPNITSVGTLTSVSVTGNTTSGNILTAGVVSATGNIAGNYFIGNGSQLTGISGGSSYGNSNVTTLLAAFGSNTISTTGTVTTGNLTLPSQGRLYGDWGNAATNNRTFVQATGNNSTRFGVIPGVGFTASGITPLSQITAFSSSDAANSAFFGTQIVGQESRLINSVNGTGTQLPLNILMGAANSAVYFPAGAGNIGFAGFGNTAPNDRIAVNGNAYVSGNITGAYIFGNGSQLTGLPATYGDSNVTTLLAAFGSNTISTSGNVTVGNLNMTGQIFDSSGVLQLNAVGNIVLTPTGTTVAQGNLSATGNIAGAYFVGNGSALTGITATAGPGGSNTQIQYNDGGSLAGNGLMTFSNTTGNINLGNLTVNTNAINANVAIDLANATAFGTTTPWRILIGNAYNGSTNSIYTSQSTGTINSPLNNPRLLVADLQTMPNTGVRMIQQSNQLWANLSANISNTSTRFSTLRNDLYIGGGTSGYTISATNTPTLASVMSAQAYVGAGTNANLSLIGNVVLSAGIVGTFSGVTVNTNSSANVASLFVGQLTTNNPNATSFGNATTQLGAIMSFSGAPANANITGTTTAIAYYMPGSTQIIPGTNQTNGNIARQATNYYSFRSDDTLAKAQLGSLSSFNEYTANVSSSGGALTVDKSVGQVQQVYTTEAITAITFSNFVTRVLKPNATYANQSDTVTLIIQQGATPYAVTMPTGTAYRYASGASVVSATANTTVMISITGTYNYNTAADQYLITISPAFS